MSARTSEKPLARSWRTKRGDTLPTRMIQRVIMSRIILGYSSDSAESPRP